MKASILIAVIVAAIICSASMAVADAVWTFDTNALTPAPSIADTTFGIPSATINVDENGTGWYDSMSEIYGSAQGWWDIGTGSIVVTMPEDPNAAPESTKDFWVQVTYWTEPSQAPSLVASPGATLVGKTTQLVEAGPIMGGWYMDTWQVHFAPVSSSLTFTITADPLNATQIEKVAVVPEPSSLLALASGIMGLASLASRRRRA